MPDWPYSDEELSKYFSDPNSRKSEVPKGFNSKPRTPIGRFWLAKTKCPEKAQAATIISVVMSIAILGVLAVSVLFISLIDELPALKEIENPDFQLATIAYTTDGQELARYALQNRSWVSYDEISPHVINALLATEDHRFYAHWGIDMFRTMAIPYHVLRGNPQGGSTISQQLARNLYNKRIGREVTVSRKLKEMVTAVQLERRYTKPEVIEMYLNTVEFGYNSYGIEAASRTFFGKEPIELDVLESATLVGMLNGTTLYNPIRNPENSRFRRNLVLGQMVKRGLLPSQYLEEHRADSIITSYKSADITESLAPYFAEHVRQWLNVWSRENGHDLYEDGLVVYTTLDSKLQQMAEAAVDTTMNCLQAVAGHEWSKADSLVASIQLCAYLDFDFEPFSYFWSSQPELLNRLISETPRFKSLMREIGDSTEVIRTLTQTPTFIDSLKSNKTRVEAGFVALDPQTGYVKAWVGGRDLATDWYDHVGTAARQPGSTFKPFVYTAAIDNGWSPYYTLPDDSVSYIDALGNEWRPENTEAMTGQMMTLREGLANSKNTITAQLMLEMGPSQVAFYARRMGIESPLLEVPSLALGTSNVTLLELTTAYSTFANGGLLYRPTLITRIEDKNGNMLYEDTPTPKEALSEATAYTMIDMLRAVIQFGTGRRINGQYGLQKFDLAGKTGTTQNSADNWFMLMHPDLVMGSWVGFNDPRFSFKSDWWGQGAHTALHIVGNFFKRASNHEDAFIIEESRFPLPVLFGAHFESDPNPPADSVLSNTRKRRGRVAW